MWRVVVTVHQGKFYLFSLLVIFIFSFSGYAEKKNQLVRNNTRGVLSGYPKFSYPPLPKSIVARFNARLAKAPRVVPSRLDAALARYWPLQNIGFFQVHTPMAEPLQGGFKPCSEEVVVAVIDTGVDYRHPELSNNVWINKKEVGHWTPPKGSLSSCRDKSCNGIDDDRNGFIDDAAGWDFVHNVPLPFDTHGHGTHIAGIIGSEAGNGIGIAGVCSKVSIMALKYYDSSVFGFNNLQNTVRAIRYAIRNGAHIINYSGGGADPAPAEREAVLAAQKKGVLFVAAAGNDGHNNDRIPYYPATYKMDNIISVASVNRANKLLNSSNYGKTTVDIAAPGLAVLSTLPSARFGTMSGTSQATAFVTGAAALLASQMRTASGKLDFDYKKIKGWILKSAAPLKRKGVLQAGLLSIPDAIKLQAKDLGRTPPPTKSSPVIALDGK